MFTRSVVQRFVQRAALFRTTHKQSIRSIGLTLAVPVSIVIWRDYGFRRMAGFLFGLLMATGAQRLFLSAMMRRVGTEDASLADVLTLSRAGTGGILAALVASGVCDRRGSAGRIGWLMLLLGVTDWLDGRLARLLGPTRLGGALDIEADSWLTLWSAAGAVAWGDLPRWYLLAPIIRYLDPLISLHHGKLPQGGGPWWSRLAGACQTGLILLALAPFEGKQRKRLLALAAFPVSAGQCLALLVLLTRKVWENGNSDS